MSELHFFLNGILSILRTFIVVHSFDLLLKYRTFLYNMERLATLVITPAFWQVQIAC